MPEIPPYGLELRIGKGETNGTSPSLAPWREGDAPFPQGVASREEVQEESSSVGGKVRRPWSAGQQFALVFGS